MMVVFQIISSIDIGGAEQVAMNIAKHSSSDIDYHIVEVIASKSDFSNRIKEDLAQRGIKFHTSPIRIKKLALVMFWSWFWIPFIKYRPQILHSHTEVPDLALWIFRRFSRLFFGIKPKYVRTIHNTRLWNKWKWVARIVEPFYQRNNCNVAISDNTRASYIANFGGRVANTITNGLTVVEQRRLDELDESKINILFAGRLSYQKGADIMMEVFRRFSDDPRLMFYIIDAGEDRPMVAKQLREQKNVVIKETIYGLNEYLGSFDYVFIPSRFEGLSLLPIEASLARTPAIINNCPGLKETLPAHWPMKSESNSADDYVAIIRGLQKGSEQARLGEMAYQFAIKNFPLDDMIHQYEEIYAAALATNGE